MTFGESVGAKGNQKLGDFSSQRLFVFIDSSVAVLSKDDSLSYCD
jgi:hypothetical protein